VEPPRMTAGAVDTWPFRCHHPTARFEPSEISVGGDRPHVDAAASVTRPTALARATTRCLLQAPTLLMGPKTHRRSACAPSSDGSAYGWRRSSNTMFRKICRPRSCKLQ
jgi:hypothetical protein